MPNHLFLVSTNQKVFRSCVILKINLDEGAIRTSCFGYILFNAIAVPQRAVNCNEDKYDTLTSILHS